MHDQVPTSRPISPESYMTNNVNSTIDDLTLALANFSRVPSPEPDRILICCCGKEDCENARAWSELKARLESRLILSAEVGQALLQRHEAYVRRHDVRLCSLQTADGTSLTPLQGRETLLEPVESESKDSDNESILDRSAKEIAELVKEKARLEKVLRLIVFYQATSLISPRQRLNQALVNNEVTEVSTKTIMQELHEARATISRLTSQHARSIGWETRLSAVIQEKDDMQQERDGESNRAKLAESRLAAMKDKAAKLQRDVMRLQEALEERRLNRLESSESLLHDARLRIEALQNSQLGQTALIEQTELTTVLESLVNDNETLKRDNAELQSMLSESREEIHVLQEEVEELRARPRSITSRAGTPQMKHRFHPSSVPRLLGRDNPEPLTPDPSLHPMSPAESLAPSEPRLSVSQPRPRYPSSHISIEVEESCDKNNDDPSSPEKPLTHKTLLLLSRSRAVQTETWPQLLSPSPLPLYMSPHDPRSESSSFSDTHSSHLSVLLDRFSGLHNRMSQADALTLTNRLKRQHLKGADIGHLSRSTVNNIISEVTNLRMQFRFLLEDDNVAVPATRKDFRVLFKLFKEIFADMAEIRVLLNDVIIDPSCASRVSEQALNPSLAEAQDKDNDSAGSSATTGWMAPISKLFSPPARAQNSGERSGFNSSILHRPSSTRPTRVIPKLGPALSSSATTVNVEFSGTVVGRSTTSTVASQAKQRDEAPGPSASSHSTSAVMNIFAGAPQHTSDPWVIVPPKGPRRVQSFAKPSSEFGGTLRRSMNRSNSSALSRDVDATIDAQGSDGNEAADNLTPLLQRTLRRRGLSDSSIHSTFTSQADVQPPVPTVPFDTTVWPTRQSVFQALRETVQSIRNTASGTGGGVETPVASTSPQQRPVVEARSSTPGHLRNLLPNWTAWTAQAGNVLDPMTEATFLVGSVRDESYIPTLTRRSGEPHTTEYF
ncbi:hypothetical protein C0995_009136 [Termitomyces sp. Mi166|nr:hypothetical protein C0995_009136 [Termitomyces sp. Mi166\